MLCALVYSEFAILTVHFFTHSAFFFSLSFVVSFFICFSRIYFFLSYFFLCSVLNDALVAGYYSVC